jgi:adenylosuccinate lyase
MRRNLGPFSSSEQALAVLSPRLGKHHAQAVLQDALAAGRASGLSLVDALRAADLLDDAVAERVAEPYVGPAGEMVDEVVRRARAARQQEPEHWP